MNKKSFFKKTDYNKLYDYVIYKALKDGTFDIIESNTKTVKNITYDEFKRYERKYEMSKYGKTEDLTEYLTIFSKCIEELRTNKGFKINWTFYFHNFLAIINTIKRLTKTKYGYLKCKTVYDSTKHEKITSNEFRYYQNTNNGGLLYTVAGTYNCYGYDYSAFYLNICIKSCEKNDDGTLKYLKEDGTPYNIYRDCNYCNYGPFTNETAHSADISSAGLLVSNPSLSNSNTLSL
jgi:hypothetical protein